MAPFAARAIELMLTLAPKPMLFESLAKMSLLRLEREPLVTVELA